MCLSLRNSSFIQQYSLKMGDKNKLFHNRDIKLRCECTLARVAFMLRFRGAICCHLEWLYSSGKGLACVRNMMLNPFYAHVAIARIYSRGPQLTCTLGLLFIRPVCDPATKNQDILYQTVKHKLDIFTKEKNSNFCFDLGKLDRICSQCEISLKKCLSLQPKIFKVMF